MNTTGITIIRFPEAKDWSALLERPVLDTISLEEKVSAVINEVKRDGDTALKKFTKQFDGVELASLHVTGEEMKEAAEKISPELKGAIAHARKNIQRFHQAQQQEVKVIETDAGVLCWRKNVAIERVGLYIPGGTAPLFSTVLMLAVPAAIAGCKEIVLCSPPGKEGRIHPAVVYAAEQCGVTKIFKLGGVQAVAAMAFGTESVPRVYKIFGPGNQYVTCAKQLVSKAGVAIDMPAGPSEVAVFADSSCVPEFVAADLLSQAEHGADSQVLLVTTDEQIIEPVMRELKMQLEKLPRKEMAERSLGNSRIILVRNREEACTLLNEYAPEHLILACADADAFAENIINAGSVFIGNFSCESAGDYASGTNHTLPTNGYAKAYSGVSLDSFVRKITFQKISEEGIRTIGPAIEAMAEAEGLHAHKHAVSVRLKTKQTNK